MWHAILGVSLSATLCAAQAGVLKNADASPDSSPRHDHHSLARASDSIDPCGSFAAALSGARYANLSFGPWNNTLWGAGDSFPAISHGATTDMGFPLAGVPGKALVNGEQQGNPVSFAVLSIQTSAWGARNHSLGVDDKNFGDADHNDPVIRVTQQSQAQEPQSNAPAPQAKIPEIQMIAMFLAGIGLLGLAAFRRTNDPFD